MRERPILFSAPMVRAILEGRKSQTRRIVRRPERYLDSQWEQAVPHNPGGGAHPLMGHCYLRVPAHDGEKLADCVMGGREHAPYEPGMKLWVKETWSILTGNGIRTVYRADGEDPRTGWDDTPAERRPAMRWHPSIFMRRADSRITLEVSAVRVERLQAITEEDAKAEGVLSDADQLRALGHLRGADAVRAVPSRPLSARQHFSELWNTINGERAPWESNPWVWVVGFRRLP